MISKDTFVTTMTRLELLEKYTNDVDDALTKLCHGCGSFYLSEPLDIVLDLLREAFDDECDCIEYLVCEKDFLHLLKPDDVLDKDGNPIDLTSWEKVYDYLIENMEEQA